MDIYTNNIKVKYQTHDRIYLVIEEDWNNRTGKLNKKFPPKIPLMLEWIKNSA